MTDAAYLLTELRRRGYTLATADGKLTVSPGSRLTDGERAEVAEFKAGLLALLADEAVSPELEAMDQKMMMLAKSGAYSWWRPGMAQRMKW